jgi:hypothetical protein
LEAEAARFCVPQENGQEKGEKSAMSYLNSITLVGFVGSDPEQRQTKGKSPSIDANIVGYQLPKAGTKVSQIASGVKGFE